MGFQMSRVLNIRNPADTEVMLKGRPNNVKIMPAISSITIHPGSSVPNIFSASLEIHMAQKINIRVNKTAIAKSISERKKQRGSPRTDPKVPGAKEMFPIKKPVARNTTDFCLKFIACLYIPAPFFCQEIVLTQMAKRPIF
jgi:hypothetical protein